MATSSVIVDEWSTLLGEEESITQASGLPDPGTFKLYKFEETLENKDDFEIWFNQISQHLKSQGLQRLIDRKIPRPSKTANDARKWQQLSIQITGYLVANISNNLVQQVRSQGVRVELADEFMEQAIKLFRGQGFYAINKAFWNLVETKKSNFSTTTEFIQAIQQRFFAANELGVIGAPYVAVITLFKQLDGEEHFRQFLTSYYNKLEAKQNPSTSITAKDFYQCCSEILQYAERNVEDGVAYEAVNNHNHNFNKSKLNNAPPKGKTAEAHTAEWKTRATTANGNCAYCGYMGHPAAKCYHLNPDTRPPDWKPRPGLWCYQWRGSRFQDSKTEIGGSNNQGVGAIAVTLAGYDFGG